MGRYTDYTRIWLDARYARRDEQGIYHAHQPIYGRGIREHCEPDHLFRLARQYQIMALLDRLRFRTFLDVGGSEGFGAHLVQTLFGAEVAITDLSTEACKRAADLFRLPGAAADATRLPFPDRAFDVVLCTEVIEHVELPLEVLLELRRVARRAVIVTSDNITPDLERARAHHLPHLPHIERNLLHTEDFTAAWGPGVRLFAQQRGTPPADDVPDAEARSWILRATADPTLEDGVGAVAWQPLEEEVIGAPRLGEDAILDAVLGTSLPIAPAERRSVIDESFRARLRCPRTGQALRQEGGVLVSEDGHHRYELDEEIPVLFAREDPTEGEVRRALAAVHGGDGATIDRALAVRSRLEQPLPPPRLHWEFSDPGQRQEWRASPGASIIEDASALRVRLSRSGAFLIGPPVRYPRSGLRGVSLELTVHRAPGGEATEARIWWLGPRDPGFAPERSLPIPLPPPGVKQRVEIALATPPNTEAEEHDYTLRLDPANGEAEVSLHAFALLPAAEA